MVGIAIVMVVQIESKLHERQGQAITNFDKTFHKVQSNLAKQTMNYRKR